MEAAGTPTGYLIDADGKVASTQAMGVELVLDMITSWPISPDEKRQRRFRGHGPAGHVS